MREKKYNNLFHNGKKHHVYLCDYAVKDWATFRKTHAQHPKGQLTQLMARLTKYADTGELLVPRHLNTEGDGYYAIKSNGGLRCYFWFEQSYMIVSHFFYKKTGNLPPQEKERMDRNRKKYGGV